MKPGDVVVGVLVGARETKVRPAVVIASATYLAERPDVLVGILTTKTPSRVPATTDYILLDWLAAGLRAESYFRAYVLTTHRSELTVIGHLSARDCESVKLRIESAQHLPFNARRDDHCAIVDLVGKGRHIRTGPWVKSRAPSTHGSFRQA